MSEVQWQQALRPKPQKPNPSWSPKAYANRSTKFGNRETENENDNEREEQEK